MNRIFRFRTIGALLTVVVLLLGGGPSVTGSPSVMATPTPMTGEPPQWRITTEGAADVQEVEGLSRGNPKLGSSLTQLLEAYHRGDLTETQTFATTHLIVIDDDRVQVVIVTTREAISNLREAVEALGGEYQGHYGTLLQALMPVDTLESLARRSDVQVVREPRRPIPLAPMQIGDQTTEGVATSNASIWHAAGYDGAGVRVAVIDAGFTDYASLLGTDLPSSVTTYDWTGTGMGGSPHGTACAEIVYDMAYGAAMDLHKISTEVELGNAVGQAIADGVDIISMSLGWTINGPGDGTGSLANIVNNARSNGIFFAVAAGNEAEVSWSGQYVDHPSASDTHQWPHGSNVNCFGPGTPDFSCFYVPAGYPIVLGLHWDDWTAVNQDYDLYLMRWTGDNWSTVASSTNTQNGGAGQTPEEAIGIYAPYTTVYGVVIVRHSATRDVCLSLNAPKMTHLDEWGPERSLSFPADSPDAITVGAVDVSYPYPLESYSSQGPTFGPGGTCSGGSTKPDIAAYANVSTVSYGAGVFNGTSAATPHVAGAAALVTEAYPSYTVTQLQNYLENEAIDLGMAGKDNLYGSGRLYLGSPPGGTPYYANSTKSVLPTGAVMTGRALTYTIVLSNSGDAPGTATTLYDPIPVGASYVPGSAAVQGGGTLTASASAIDWSGTVTDGQSVTVTFEVTVTALPGSNITNTATISDPQTSAPVILGPVINQVLGVVSSLSEDFENGGVIPVGWTNDPGDGGEDWLFGTSTTYGASMDHTSGSGYFAYLDDSAPHDTPANLLSPVIDLTGLTTPTLQFWLWNRQSGATPVSELHIDIYDGSTWATDVAVFDSALTSWTQFSVDLTPYKSALSQIRFRGIESTSYTSDISLDDVSIIVRDPSMGQLRGTVTSDWPGGLLEGALVEVISGTTSVISGTTDVSGSYGPWWLMNGTYTVTVSADGYITDTQGVNISAGVMITHDVTLALSAPQVGVSPGSYDEILAWGDMVTRVMTITNNGPAPLKFVIAEREGSFAPLAGGDILLRGDDHTAADGAVLFPMDSTNAAFTVPITDTDDNDAISLQEQYEADVKTAQLNEARRLTAPTNNPPSFDKISRPMAEVDTDDDGMPDAWESANGLNPNDPSDAWTDPDSDDVISLFEYQLSSDPNNASTPVIVTVSAGQDVEAAIGAALTGQVIRVEGGTYDVNYMTFSPKTIMIQGGWNSDFTRRDLGAAPTIFDGQSLDEVLYFSFNSGTNSVILDGLTLTNGEGNFGALNMLASGTSIMKWSVMNCTIVNSESTGTFGGATYILHWGGSESDVFIINSSIANNSSSGMYNQTTSTAVGRWKIINSDITNNQSLDAGEGYGIEAFTLDDAVLTTTLKNTILWGNQKTDLEIRRSITVEAEYSDVGTVQASSGAIYNPGAGMINSDPLFVAPDDGGFTLQEGSPCIDAGTNSGVPPTDFEGDPRPTDGDNSDSAEWDIGADEFTDVPWLSEEPITGTVPAYSVVPVAITFDAAQVDQPGIYQASLRISSNDPYSPTVSVPVTMTVTSPVILSISKTATPDPVQAGDLLTYTIRVTNTGNIDLHATVTDILPAQVVPSGILTWTPTIPALGGVWTEQLSTTVAIGYIGPLTNVVRATTVEGANGAYTETSVVVPPPPGVPELLAPPDGTITTTSAITFTWTPTTTGASPTGYNLKLDGTIITTTGTTSATILSLGVHTWTVRAYNATGYSDWTTAWTVEITETLPPHPVLGIAKTGPEEVSAGDLLTYTIVVSNTGNADATGVVITDTIPISTAFARADSGGTLVGDQVRWAGETVNASGSLAVTFVVTVPGSLPGGTDIVNADYGVICTEGVSAVGRSVITHVSAPAPIPEIYFPLILMHWPPSPNMPAPNPISDPDSNGHYTVRPGVR